MFDGYYSWAFSSDAVTVWFIAIGIVFAVWLFLLCYDLFKGGGIFLTEKELDIGTFLTALLVVTGAVGIGMIVVILMLPLLVAATPIVGAAWLTVKVRNEVKGNAPMGD